MIIEAFQEGAELKQGLNSLYAERMDLMQQRQEGLEGLSIQQQHQGIKSLSERILDLADAIDERKAEAARINASLRDEYGKQSLEVSLVEGLEYDRHGYDVPISSTYKLLHSDGKQYRPEGLRGNPRTVRGTIDRVNVLENSLTMKALKGHVVWLNEGRYWIKPLDDQGEPQVTVTPIEELWVSERFLPLAFARSLVKQ